MSATHKHISRHEVASQNISHLIQLLAAIGLVCVICYAPTKDAADDDKARAHVEQQAKAQMGGRE